MRLHARFAPSSSLLRWFFPRAFCRAQFTLNTDRRSAERRQFEEQLAEKEKTLADARAAREALEKVCCIEWAFCTPLPSPPPHIPW